MEGLQRSSSTFRRSGSSGLVWDERFLTEEAEAKAGEGGGTEGEPQPDLRRSRSAGGLGLLSRRAGGGADDKKQQQKKKEKKQGQKEEERDPQVFRTKDVAPDVDPPSPRVSGCILCSIFSGSGKSSGSAARRGGRAKAKKKQR